MLYATVCSARAAILLSSCKHFSCTHNTRYHVTVLFSMFFGCQHILLVLLKIQTP
jgi:hypothetical protein